MYSVFVCLGLTSHGEQKPIVADEKRTYRLRMRVSFRGLVKHTSGQRSKQKSWFKALQLTLTCSIFTLGKLQFIMFFNMHLLIWHAYSILHFRHLAVSYLWFHPLQLKIILFYAFTLWKKTQAEVKRSTGWMGSRRVLLVFWKAKQTGIHGCKKVSCMNGRSSNVWRPAARTKVSHWRAVCVDCKEIRWYSLKYHQEIL